MSDIERILKAALSPTKYPSEQLNGKIMEQIKESGKLKMSRRRVQIAVAIVLCVLIIPTSVYAAYRYLLPKEAAYIMQDEKLGEAFDKDGKAVLETKTDGDYKVTFLGQVTGESISERTGSAWELQPERIYIAVAIERVDGKEMTYDESLFISPLIQGLRPWTYNIATMNGSYMEKIIDGVRYRIIECDNIEMFADKELYLAVSNTNFYSTDAYSFDEVTGLITVNEAYAGTNLLFDIELDPSKADHAKVEKYIKEFEKDWNSENNTEDNTNDTQGEDSVKENARTQQEIFLDEENGIKIQVQDNDSSSWWADDNKSETVLRYRFQVEGDGIESLTYNLNQGEFCYYPKHQSDGREFYGNKYSLSYEEQENIDYAYSILFSAEYEDYGYDTKELNALGVKDILARDKIYYEVLDKEIEATNLDLEIKMKDGRTINKTVRFDNVLGEDGPSFWIALSID